MGGPAASSLQSTLDAVGNRLSDGITTSAQLQTAVESPAPRPAVDLERAAIALANLSTLVDAASTDVRRALLRTLFAALYIEHGVKTITPTLCARFPEILRARLCSCRERTPLPKRP